MEFNIEEDVFITVQKFVLSVIYSRKSVVEREKSNVNE